MLHVSLLDTANWAVFEHTHLQRTEALHDQLWVGSRRMLWLPQPNPLPKGMLAYSRLLTAIPLTSSWDHVGLVGWWALWGDLG